MSALSQVGEIEKGWGKEIICHSTERFCVKYLVFGKKGSKFSFHYHKKKYEEWTVAAGSFELETGEDAEKTEGKTTIVRQGNVIKVSRQLVHRLTALEDGSVILEVSTADDPTDSYRVSPGDSQDAHQTAQEAITADN